MRFRFSFDEAILSEIALKNHGISDYLDLFPALFTKRMETKRAPLKYEQGLSVDETNLVLKVSDFPFTDLN